MVHGAQVKRSATLVLIAGLGWSGCGDGGPDLPDTSKTVPVVAEQYQRRSLDAWVSLPVDASADDKVAQAFALAALEKEPIRAAPILQHDHQIVQGISQANDFPPGLPQGQRIQLLLRQGPVGMTTQNEIAHAAVPGLVPAEGCRIRRQLQGIIQPTAPGDQYRHINNRPVGLRMGDIVVDANHRIPRPDLCLRGGLQTQGEHI